MTYGPDGYLANATDALGRIAMITSDTAGRVTGLTLPGGRAIGFTYDLNGNVCGITPPGREEHAFTYNLRDDIASYLPPVVAASRAKPATPTTPTENRRASTSLTVVRCNFSMLKRHQPKSRGPRPPAADLRLRRRWPAHLADRERGSFAGLHLQWRIAHRHDMERRRHWKCGADLRQRTAGHQHSTRTAPIRCPSFTTLMTWRFRLEDSL